MFVFARVVVLFFYSRGESRRSSQVGPSWRGQSLAAWARQFLVKWQGFSEEAGALALGPLFC